MKRAILPEIFHPPNPTQSGKERDFATFKTELINRALVFTTIFFTNQAKFQALAEERESKIGQFTKGGIEVTKSVSAAASRSTNDLVLKSTALLASPATLLFEYLSKEYNKTEAFRKLWLLDTTEKNREKLRNQVIRSAVELFISFEYPCSLAGTQFEYYVAFDAVHRAFQYFTTQTEKLEDSDRKALILKGVLCGKSKKGALDRVTAAKGGFSVGINGQYNTRKIFEKPGSVLHNNIIKHIKKPEHGAYGYRLMFPFEDGYTQKPIDSELRVVLDKRPRTSSWEEDGLEALIQDVIAEVKQSLDSKQTQLVDKIESCLISYFENLSEEMRTNTETILERMDINKDVILDGVSVMIRAEVKSFLAAVGTTHNQQEALKPEDVSKYTQARNRIMELDEDGLATRILNIISCFGTENIKTNIFVDPEVTQERVDQAVKLLKSNSMASGYKNDVIKVSRNLQRDTINNLKRTEDFDEVVQDGIELLQKYMENSQFTESMIPHAKAVWLHALNYEDLVLKFAIFPLNICEKLQYYHKCLGIIELTRSTHGAFQSIFGEKSGNILRLKYFEAYALEMLEKVSESAKPLQDIYTDHNTKMVNVPESLELYRSIHNDLTAGHAPDYNWLLEFVTPKIQNKS